MQMRVKMICGDRGQKPPYQSEDNRLMSTIPGFSVGSSVAAKKVDRARRAEEGVEVWQQRIITVNRNSPAQAHGAEVWPG